jgi:hypothetical protein
MLGRLGKEISIVGRIDMGEIMALKGTNSGGRVQ